MQHLRFCIVLLIAVIATATELENKLALVEQSQEGRALLKTIAIKFRAGDPVEHVIRMLEQLRDSNEMQLDYLSKQHAKDMSQCESDLAELKDRLGELEYQGKDTSISLGNTKPQKELLQRRLSMQQDYLKQLKWDLQRQQDLRDTQQQLYNFNVDQLEKAIFAITEVRKLFVKYLTNSQHRRRVMGQGGAFLQSAGIDVESALNDDFRDDAEDDDDVEERRLHYQRFAFIEIQVGVKKAREALEGIVGVQNLLQGFEDLASILHNVKEDPKTAGIFLENTDQSLEEVTQTVIDICSHMTDWVGQLRHWEDKTEEAKRHMSNKTVKLIKQTIQDTQIEVERMADQNRQLSQRLNQLDSLGTDLQQRLDSKRQELQDRQEQCDLFKFDFDRENERISFEMVPLEQLLELFEQKGGQLKKVIAQKIYN